MDPELKKLLDEQSAILKKIYISTEKTRKYFLWTFIIGLVVTVVPLIGLIFVIPAFLNNYLGSFKGLGL